MRVPRTKDLRVEADKESRCKPQELKSLVESGSYKPDPSRIADGDAEPARRPRAAHCRADCGQPQLVVTRLGSSSSAPGQPDLDPLAGDDLADRRQRCPRASASRRCGVEPLRRQRRQQLVVLAARGGQLERIAAGRGGDLGDARRRAAGPPASIRRPTPLAAARWPASPPSPSLRSIIARRPGRGQRPAGGEPRGRVELARRAARSAVSAGTAVGAARASSSSSRPAAAPPSSPVRTSDVAGPGAAAGDEAARALARGRRR